MFTGRMDFRPMTNLAKHGSTRVVAGGEGYDVNRWRFLRILWKRVNLKLLFSGAAAAFPQCISLSSEGHTLSELFIAFGRRRRRGKAFWGLCGTWREFAS